MLICVSFTSRDQHQDDCHSLDIKTRKDFGKNCKIFIESSLYSWKNTDVSKKVALLMYKIPHFHKLK